MKSGPLERTSAEELLAAASGGNLPTVLIQCPEDAGGEFKQILGYLVQSRAGGFMVLLPAAEWVQPMIEALEKADGPDPLFHFCPGGPHKFSPTARGCGRVFGGSAVVYGWSFHSRYFASERIRSQDNSSCGF